MNELPFGLLPCDPRLRHFPDTWKNAKYREGLGPQGFICPCCNQPKQYKELEADHIIPFSRGGRTEWSNLQLLCKACNRRKSSRQGIVQLS